MKISGVAELRRDLQKLNERYGSKHTEDVLVGYTQNYAIWVHELHKTKSKYLEAPARELVKELRMIVATLCKKGIAVTEAMVVAGLQLQRESQLRVPVDTGALRASAFTAKESEAEEKAVQALLRSNVRKTSKKGKHN